MLPTSLLHFKSGHPQLRKGYIASIDTIEDILRAFSILLPGRFTDGDLCSQSILTALNLVSLYNTHYLVRVADKTQDKPDVFAFNRYLRKCFQLSRPFKWVSLCLSVVSYSEVLAEMIWARSGNSSAKHRWKLITYVESIKLILRLLLYFGAKKRMVLHPTHFLRNVDTHTLSFDREGEDRFELGHLDARLGLPSTADADLTQSVYPLPRVGWAHLAELLWMARPLVYVLTLSRVQNHRKSESSTDERDVNDQDNRTDWRPWLVSLAIELSAALLRQSQSMVPLEKDEAKRRNYLLLFYLLREPVYSIWARPFLDWLSDAADHRPLVSIITSAINDYRPFWERCYFYTSAS
ncbi:peroxisome membrane protein [Hesseltinella vesiculosa]|uniref:Peroxisomal membrane protein PEX16 n=1 Tax=Hesseltinella vesiculosa TaxID=101127 RepID=A0A1X2GKV4_9FUNG|nr:peroxisome membrane protein [Hesseltinella vesiculosa]